jgi:hypothetical protein
MPTLYGPPWMYRLSSEGRLVDEAKAKRDAEISARVDDALFAEPPPLDPGLQEFIDNKAAPPQPPSFLSDTPANLPPPPPRPMPTPVAVEEIAPPLPADKPPGSFLGIPTDKPMLPVENAFV